MLWPVATLCAWLVFFLHYIPPGVFDLYLMGDGPASSDPIGMPFVQNYSAKDYQMHEQIWDVVIDRRGVVYAANSGGIAEYDGVSWRQIFMPNRSICRSLELGSDGVVYAGLQGDLGYLAADPKGVLGYMSLVEKVPEKDRVFGMVLNIHATSRGVYFVTGDRVFYWDGKGMTIIPVKRVLDSVLMGDSIVVGSLQGIYLVQPAKIDLLPYTEDLMQIPGASLAARFSEHRLIVWIPEKGFYLYDLSTRKAPDAKEKTLFSVLERYPIQAFDYIKNNLPTSFDVLDSGRFAIGTYRGGVVIINRQGELIRILNRNRGLRSNTVWSARIDQHGNLWLALNNGLAYVHLGSPLEKINDINGFQDTGLSLAKHAGKVYVSGFQGVTYLPRYIPQQDDDRYLVSPVDGMRHECFYLFSYQNELFAFSTTNGVYHIVGKQAFPIQGTSTRMAAFRFARSKRFPNLVFAAVLGGGLVVLKLERQANEFKGEIFSLKSMAEMKEVITSMDSDADGNIWLVANSKLTRMRFTSDDPEAVVLDRFGISQGLPDLVEMTVFGFGPDVFVTGREGVYRFVPSGEKRNKGKSIAFEPDPNLADRLSEHDVVITQIYAADDTYIVVDTEQGYGAFVKDASGRYRWNGKIFQKVEGTVADVLMTEDAIWMGCADVLYRFDRNRTKNYASDFNALMRKVLIHDREVAFGGFYYQDNVHSKQKFSVGSLEQPSGLVYDLTYEKNSLSFEFAAAYFEHNSSNQYSHLLEGYDKQWSLWTDTTRRDFTNLPEGSYVFRVKAKNLFGHESREASFAFVIRAPWYRTHLAYVGMAALFFGLLYVGIAWNTRRLVAAKRRLEVVVDERTLQVREQKERLEISNQQLEESLQQLRETQRQLVDASWKAGMAEVATGILHNLGNMLNSVNVSSGLLRENMKKLNLEKLQSALSMLQNIIYNIPASAQMDPKTETIVSYLTKSIGQLEKFNLENLDEIDNLSRHIEQINTMVATQQMHAGPSEVIETIQLGQLMDAVLKMSKLQQDKKLIKIVHDYEKEQTMTLERYKVSQILLNLINNAHQALMAGSSENKLLKIQIYRLNDDTMRFSIIDNGVGMAKERLQKLFVFGYSTKKHGRGYGLHAGANAAKQMGGSISAESEGEGLGATFFLDLPIRPKKNIQS